jgi:hypothetical protein
MDKDNTRIGTNGFRGGGRIPVLTAGHLAIERLRVIDCDSRKGKIIHLKASFVTLTAGLVRGGLS